MNKLYLLLVFLLSTFMDIQGQVVAVKTNVLYDAITTPNVGAEVAFNKHWSVEASGYYNGWTFSSDKSFKHWVIQPEVTGYTSVSTDISSGFMPSIWITISPV